MLMCLAKAKSTLDTELASPPEHLSEVERLQKTVSAVRRSPFCLLTQVRTKEEEEPQHKVEGAEREELRA